MTCYIPLHAVSTHRKRNELRHTHAITTELLARTRTEYSATPMHTVLSWQFLRWRQRARCVPRAACVVRSSLVPRPPPFAYPLQPTAGEERPWKDWVLEKETELRLEVPEDGTIDIKVASHSPHTPPSHATHTFTPSPSHPHILTVTPSHLHTLTSCLWEQLKFLVPKWPRIEITR